MRMRKQTIVKDDGRLLIYYWFEREKGMYLVRTTLASTPGAVGDYRDTPSGADILPTG